MAGNHVLSISSLSSFFKDNLKQFKRGEIADKDGQILKFQADLEQNIVVGDVKLSMKSDPYKVRILLNELSISDAHCSCPRGVAICPDLYKNPGPVSETGSESVYPQNKILHCLCILHVCVCIFFVKYMSRHIPSHSFITVIDF